MTGSLSHLAAALPSIRTDRDFTGSGRDAVVVIQHASQALAPLDYTGFSKMAHCWANEPVGQALVISLGVVVGDEILNGRPQRILSEQDHPIQTGLLNSPHKSLGMCIQIRRSGR